MRIFGKKSEGGDGEDTNRSALFGNRRQARSPAASNPYAQPTPSQGNPYAQSSPQSGNPYAQAPSQSGNPYAQSNPYAQPPMNPYAAAKQKAYSGSEPPSQGPGGSAGGSRSGGDTKSPAYTGTTAGGAYGGGYSQSHYGNQTGYGSDRYGTSGGDGSGMQRGTGGYGGLGGERRDDDEARNALFAGAHERVQQKQQQAPGGYGAPPAYDSGDQSQRYGLGSGSGGGYDPGPKYEDRQLTAEEEEEEEINATKQQIRFLKQDDVATTRNALRIAQQAEEVGRDTLARLGQQGEHIHDTEYNLDQAHNQNQVAADKAKELKTLNRSMFAVHVSNPFTSKQREARKDREAAERHLEQREQREGTRRAAYLSEQRMQQNFQKLSVNDQAKKEKNLAERAKYQFEADSEDEEMENEIDSNLDALTGVTSRLNQLAKATGAEIEQQNKHLDRIMVKGDKVDVDLAQNRARLDRIR